MKKYIVLCLLLAVLAGCGQQIAEEKSEKTQADTSLVELSLKQVKSAGIEVGTPTVGNLKGALKLQGMIDVPPQSTVSVSFPLGGYLKSTDLLPGVHVRKGQVLGILEDMQFIQIQQDYLSAKEQLQFAEAEYRRQHELNNSKATSDKVFQRAKTEVETQRILLHSLAQKLELIGIRPQRLTAATISKSVRLLSPIDGFVSKVNVNIGRYTSPTDVLFELVNPKDIHLTLDVFEKDISQLAVGQKVVAYTTNTPDKKYNAKIILVSRNLNADRVASVHCHFDKFDASLLPGMFMNAEVETDKSVSLTVPEEAVVRWQNKFYVFVPQVANTYRMVPVTTGSNLNGLVEIAGAGISNETKLVKKKAYILLMKLKNSNEDEDAA